MQSACMHACIHFHTDAKHDPDCPSTFVTIIVIITIVLTGSILHRIMFLILHCLAELYTIGRMTDCHSMAIDMADSDWQRPRDTEH